MLFSIIIPTYNRNKFLENCLEQLSPKVQNIKNDAYEVIVSDDSYQNSASALIKTKFSWANWVPGSKRGPAANRNNGAKHAKGDWLVFIDDDCVPGTNLICAYKNALKNNVGVKVFEGCIKANRDKENFIEESPINEEGGNLWSCNFMVEKNLFLSIHGFDDHFPYAAMEDVDLQCRLKKLNEKILFVRDALVIHPWRTEKRILYKTKKRFASTLYFLNKHPEMKNRINAAYFFKSGLINIKNAFKYAYKFKFKGFGKQLILVVFYFYFAIFLFAKR